MILNRSLLALSLAGLLLTGCATNESKQAPAPAEQAQPTKVSTQTDIMKGVTVYYANEHLALSLPVIRGHLQLSQQGGLPILTVTVQNTTPHRFQMEYQVNWLDQYGTPISNQVAWFPKTVTGNAPLVITSTGKSPEAKQATITIRTPQNVEIYVPEPDPVELMKAQKAFEQFQQQQMLQKR